MKRRCGKLVWQIQQIVSFYVVLNFIMSSAQKRLPKETALNQKLTWCKLRFQMNMENNNK